MSEELRRCTGCKQPLPWGEFDRGKGPNGLKLRCRECAKERKPRCDAPARTPRPEGDVKWCSQCQAWLPTDEFSKGNCWCKPHAHAASCESRRKRIELETGRAPAIMPRRNQDAPEGTRWCAGHQAYVPIGEFPRTLGSYCRACLHDRHAANHPEAQPRTQVWRDGKRWCPGCQDYRPPSEFWRGARKDGLQSCCKPCHSARVDESKRHRKEKPADAQV